MVYNSVLMHEERQITPTKFYFKRRVKTLEGIDTLPSGPQQEFFLLNWTAIRWLV